MKIVMTGGKFNKIHPGHIWLLKEAKKLGFLVIVLAHDSHNKRTYAVPASKRKAALQSLGIADKIIVGSPTSFLTTVKKVHPNLIVLGYDQTLPDIDTGDFIREHKIIVVKMRKFGSHSTRKSV